MNCKKANELMMDYFDSPLGHNIRKTERLRRHMQKCTACREDFAAYDEMITSFQFRGELIMPSADMEAKVMAGIFSLEMAGNKDGIVKENIIFTIWGVISVIIGVYFIYALKIDAAQSFLASVTGVISELTALFGQYQYAFILPAIALVIIQSKVNERLNGTEKSNDG